MGEGMIVEWSVRGYHYVVGKSVKTIGAGEVKKVMSRGIEGLRRSANGVQSVGLKDVCSIDRMRAMVSLMPFLVLNPPTDSLIDAIFRLYQIQKRNLQSNLPILYYSPSIYH